MVFAAQPSPVHHHHGGRHHKHHINQHHIHHNQHHHKHHEGGGESVAYEVSEIPHHSHHEEPFALRPAKSLTIAYIFWFFLGIIGFHRLYLRNRLFIVYFLTASFFGIGWIIDLFLLPKLVRKYNEQYCGYGITNTTTTVYQSQPYTPVYQVPPQQQVYSSEQKPILQKTQQQPNVISQP